MKIKLFIALIVMCLCLVSCDMGNLGGLLDGSGESTGSNDATNNSVGDGTFESNAPDGELGNGDVSSDVTEDSSASTEETTDSSNMGGEATDDTDLPSGGTDKEEDDGTEEALRLGFEELEKILYNADLGEEDKAELTKKIEVLRAALEQIKGDEALSKDEKSDLRDDVLHDLQDTLEDMSESKDKAIKEIVKELKKSENDLVSALGKALSTKDEEGIKGALEDIVKELESLSYDSEDLKEELDNKQEELDQVEQNIQKIEDDMEKADQNEDLTEDERYELLDELVEEKEELENEKEELEQEKEEIQEDIQCILDMAYSLISDIYDSAKDAKDSEITDAIKSFAEGLFELANDALDEVDSLIKDIEKAFKKDKVGKEIAKAIDKIRHEIVRSLAGKDVSDIFEDLKDIVEGSDASPQDKEEAKDWLDKTHIEILQNIINNEELTEAQKQEALFNKLGEIVFELYENALSYAEKYEAQINVLIEESNKLFENIGSALLTGDIDALMAAIDEIKQINEMVTDQAWAMLVGGMGDAVNSIIKNEGISQKIRDIVEKYSEKIEKALEKYQIDSIEAAKELVDIALDELAEHLKNFMTEHFGKVEEFKEMIKLLEVKLGLRNEVDEEADEDEKPDVENGEQQESEQKPNDEQKPSEGESDKKEEDFVPGISDELLNEEFEKEFGRPMTEEELEKIKEYLELLGKENQDSEGEQKPNDEPKEEPNEEPKEELEEQKEYVYVPGIGNISVDALLNDELLNEEFEKEFGRPMTEEERQMIKTYLQMIKVG